MPGLLLAIMPRLLMVMAVAGALGVAWYKVNNWCNGACVTATKRAETAETAIKAAQERATALALLWARAIDQVEASRVESRRRSEYETQRLRKRSRTIASSSSSGTILVAPALGELFDDTSRFANSPPADPPSDQGPAQAVPAAPRKVDGEELTQKWIEAAAAYRDAVEKLTAMIEFYEQLRAAQLETLND